MELRNVVLHVASIETSVALYSDLLGTQPDRPSPFFASFRLPSGFHVELWQRSVIEPASVAPGGAIDLTFDAERRDEVDRIFAAWKERGLHVLMPPTEKVFGYTFVVADPDGHRLRLLHNPAAQQGAA